MNNQAIIEQVIIMGILVAIGFLCRKIKLLDENSTKRLSSLVLNVATPMVILVSYQKPFDAAMLDGLLISFLLAAISYAICFVLVPFMVNGKDKGSVTVERFACIYSNCAFMGIPLIEGVYGTDGVFYLTAYITLFNILVWTHGLLSMKGGGFKFKNFAKALLSPAIIATAVGIVLFLLNISLPSYLLSVAKHLSGINTPMAMIIAGSTIATVHLGKALLKPKLYYVCLLRLIVLPAVFMAVCLLLKLDATISGVNIIAAACPTAAICTMFAVKFNKNAGYASELFAATTLLSMVTLPLVLMAYNVLA